MAIEGCPEGLCYGLMGCHLTERNQGGRERHDLVIPKDLKRRRNSYPTYNRACIGV